MNNKLAAVTMGAMFLLSAPAAFGQQEQQGQTQGQMQGKKGTTGAVSAADQRFAREAAESGMAEVATSQLAMEKAANADVKTFAQRMIDDHTKANQELMQIAASKNITMPQGTMGMMSSSGQQSGQRTDSTGTQPRTVAPTETQTDQRAANLSGKHRDTYNRLAKLSGDQFDKEYMRTQLKAHEQAIALFNRETNSGNDSELKAFAAKTLPTLQEHQRMAQETAGKIGVTAGNSNSTKTKSTSAQTPPQE